MAPAIEIIDLLSSPDIAAPLPRPKTKPAAARPKSPPRPARALDYDDDIFDFTGGSHHHARPLRASPPRAVAKKRPSNSPPKACAVRRNYSTLSGYDNDDDFFLDVTRDGLPPVHKKARTSSGSLGHAGGSSTSTGTQRRASSSGSTKPAAAPSTFSWGPSTGAVGWGAPGVLKPAASRRLNNTTTVVDDPIQTSSDPFASSPQKRVVGKGKDVVKGIENNIIDLSFDDEDLDIFASSPVLPKAKDKSPQAKRSTDYLFSSPYSGKGKARDSVSPRVGRQNTASSPLFVSSRAPSKPVSPVKRAGAKGKEKAWDHISSSAPEVGLLSDDWDMDIQPRRTNLVRSRSDGGAKDFDLGDPDTFDLDSDANDDDDLPEVGGLKSLKSKSTTAGKSISKVTKRSTTSKPSSSRKTPAEQEDERLEKAIAKEAQKQRKQREKDEAKEQRRVDKERAAALAEVNKVKTDKKISTPEMIVDMPTSLDPALKLQVEAFLADLNVASYSHPTPVDDVVTWRRKVKARLHDEGHWEPIPECIEKECHALVIVPAAEFVKLARGPKGSDLEAHVLKMLRHYDGHTIIYLIEALTPFLRKNQNTRNRQFQARVRAGTSPPAQQPPSSTQGGRKRKDPKPQPPTLDEEDEALIENALLSLQVEHHALVHHTDSRVQTAEWVKVLTQQISLIPYKRQKERQNDDVAFCMDSGQVRTGDNARDTYVRMLEEMERCTKAMAYGIVGEFESVGGLVRALEREGPLALAGVRKGANQDGAFSNGTVGQAMSKRVCKVFLGRDESSTEV